MRLKSELIMFERIEGLIRLHLRNMERTEGLMRVHLRNLYSFRRVSMQTLERPSSNSDFIPSNYYNFL